MTCAHCGNTAHLDFEDRTVRCNPCHRTPAWCRCEPVDAAPVPEWVRRAKARTLPAKAMAA